MNLRNFLEQILKFSSIGAILAVASIVIFYVLLDVLQWPVYPVYIVVYIIAIFISYFFNAKYTFNRERNTQDGLRYYLIYFLGLGMGLLCIYLLKQYFGFSDFVNVLLSMPVRVGFTFLMVRSFIFNTSMR